MIPKKIHYCWFGEKKFSNTIKECINSWHEICPDYEIIFWNEDNFDIEQNEYVREAYKNKKYAFVSDYARFKILYEHGGIYLDTDVKLIKTLDDFLNTKCFMGFENDVSIAPGLIMGAEKKSVYMLEFMNYYNTLSFYLEDGNLNLKTVCDIVTENLEKKGLQKNGKSQIVENIHIYSQEYFAPYNIENNILRITPNTYSIHLYEGSWLNTKEKKYKKKIKFYNKIEYIFGKKFLNIILSFEFILKNKDFFWVVKKIMLKCKNIFKGREKTNE